MGIFYPPHLLSDQQLSFSAQHFTIIEIDFSFYKLPKRSVFESWREQPLEKFVFAVKGSRYLTHITGYEAMNMIRKGQIQGVEKGDIKG